MPKVKIGGQLVDVAKETLDQLTTTAGLAGAPVTPLGASTIGANEDVTKMQGTPNQLRNAVRVATEQTSLRDYRRLEAGKAPETKEDARAQMDFSSLSRVDEALSRKLAQSVQESMQLNQYKINLDVDVLQGASVDEITRLQALTPLLQKYKASQVDPNAPKLTDDEILSLDRQLGDLGLNLDTIGTIMESPDKALRRELAANQPEQVTLGMLTEGLPEDEARSLLEEFNIDERQLEELFKGRDWKNVTYQEFKREVAERREEFADVRELERLLVDPNTSRVVQSEARKRLRELGYIGVRDAEQKINNLQAQVEDGDAVRLGNNTFTIEEIIYDEAWMDVIANLANNPNELNRLKTDPATAEFANWVESNYNAIQEEYDDFLGIFSDPEEIREKLAGEVTDIEERRKHEARREELGLAGDVRLDDDVYSAVKSRIGDINRALTGIGKNDDSTRSEVVSLLGKLKDLNPTVYKMFTALADKPGDSGKMRNLINTLLDKKDKLFSKDYIDELDRKTEMISAMQSASTMDDLAVAAGFEAEINAAVSKLVPFFDMKDESGRSQNYLNWYWKRDTNKDGKIDIEDVKLHAFNQAMKYVTGMDLLDPKMLDEEINPSMFMEWSTKEFDRAWKSANRAKETGDVIDEVYTRYYAEEKAAPEHYDYDKTAKERYGWDSAYYVDRYNVVNRRNGDLKKAFDVIGGAGGTPKREDIPADLAHLPMSDVKRIIKSALLKMQIDENNRIRDINLVAELDRRKQEVADKWR